MTRQYNASARARSTATHVPSLTELGQNKLRIRDDGLRHAADDGPGVVHSLTADNLNKTSYLIEV